MVHYLAGQLSSQLNITGQTLVKPASGKLVSVTLNSNVTALTINDAASTGAAAAGNQIIALTGLTAGGVLKFDFPFLNGLVVTPTGGAVAVSFE